MRRIGILFGAESGSTTLVAFDRVESRPPHQARRSKPK